MSQLKVNPIALFTPGDKPHRFEKASLVGANAIILDLEDAVSKENKAFARENVINYLQRPNEKIVRLIRINNINSVDGLNDLLSLSKNKIYVDGLVHPKTESPAELNIISNVLNTNHGRLPLIAIIESAKGMQSINSIVSDSLTIEGLLFGAADYCLDIGCEESISALIMARQTVVRAAGLKKIACYDSPYFDFNNDEGLKQESLLIKEYGFSGKAAIHPKQVSIMKDVFTPSLSEFDQARQMIQIYEEEKGAACQLDGKMIDVPVYEKAKYTVFLYENLTKR